MIRVGVFGAGGRMGATVSEAVVGAHDMELVAAVDPWHAGERVDGTDVAIAPDASALAAADVAVDFTVVEAARENIRWCAANGVHAVVGTTGLSEPDMAEFSELFAAGKANAVIAPNFAIGAVMMMRFAELAAPFFESVEIIEMHHERKIDAPSGTSIATAQRVAAASKDWVDDPTTKVVADSARGAVVEGIPVHALRVRGMVASQEVLFGATGQSLSIRHDTYDRSSFMPGVLLAVRRVGEAPGLTVGLDNLLGV
jgi:4-hydroxy-tetrahydrodipicolinate reductase